MQAPRDTGPRAERPRRLTVTILLPHTTVHAVVASSFPNPPETHVAMDKDRNPDQLVLGTCTSLNPRIGYGAVAPDVRAGDRTYWPDVARERVRGRRPHIFCDSGKGCVDLHRFLGRCGS